MVLVDEALEMIGKVEEITHVLMCAGVCSIAAAVFIGFFLNSQKFHKLRPDTTIMTPRFVIIEPSEADCLFQSSQSGKLEHSAGNLQTIMAGLACRTPSPAAFKLLSWLASDFVTVADSVAADGMKDLAAGNHGDIPIVCGESSGASRGLMLQTISDATLRAELGLDQHSKVVLFGCEGATDVQIYENIVGISPQAVFEKQANHLESYRRA